MQYVTSLEDRLALIKQTGIDSVATVSFTSDFSLTDAGDFVRMLVEELQLARLIIGEDFALGRQRGGDPEALQALGRELGFDVEVIELLTQDSADKVSSTEIRRALSEGDVELVSGLLGRRFSLARTGRRGLQARSDDRLCDRQRRGRQRPRHPRAWRLRDDRALGFGTSSVGDEYWHATDVRRRRRSVDRVSHHRLWRTTSTGRIYGSSLCNDCAASASLTAWRRW